MELTQNAQLQSNTLETLQALISKKFGISQSDLQPQRPLVDYGLDSLGLVELLFSVEDHFSIRIPEERAEIDNLQKLAELVDEVLRANR